MAWRVAAMVALALTVPLTPGCLQEHEGTPAATNETSPTPSPEDGARNSTNGEDDGSGTDKQDSNQTGSSDQETDAEGDEDADEADNATGPWAGDPRVTGLQPLDVDASLVTTDIQVLLVPPTHGDLGEPTNDSRRAQDYLTATIDGIHDWDRAIDAFVQRYPRFDHLAQIDVQIQVLDGEPPEAVGYDVIVAYVESAGPAFRGIASSGTPIVQEQLAEAGLLDTVHASTRVILLSLFGSSPGANQTVPDYPETREVHDVTMHEFGHTFGLGHTRTWTAQHGPDLMNSPYPFVYGDGSPVGDGGERSPSDCISTMDLYGLATAYGWLENESYEAVDANVTVPDGVPYEEICAPGASQLPVPSPLDAPTKAREPDRAGQGLI